MNCAKRAAVLAMGAFFVGRAAGQAVLVESKFDAGANGWTVVAASSFCDGVLSPGSRPDPSWFSSGGSSGGYIRNIESGNSGSDFFRAPAHFHGDLSAALGGSLVFELRFATGDPDIFYSGNDVILQGGGLTLYADTPNPSRDDWGQTRVPFTEGHWRLGACNGPMATESEILQTLAGVTELYLSSEHVTGNETLDLDSVVIDSTPIDESCAAIWSELDAAEPVGRWAHTVAIDTHRGVMVLFGGITGESDTWEFDLTSETWTRYQPEPSPSRRLAQAMVYDRARQKVVMTGGRWLDRRYNEVWEYDVASHTWSQSEPLDVIRNGHAMAYDTDRDTIVLYGGRSDTESGAFDVLERSSSSDEWVVRSSVVNPGPQFGNAMAYDAERGLTVHIGEGTDAVTVSEWDGFAGEWTIRSFTGDIPGSRGHGTLVYDEARMRSVLMGGDGNSGTWDYDGVVWTPRAAINPGGRHEHAAAYDSIGSRVLLSGGILGSHTPQRDLLAFDGASNSWNTVWNPSAMGPRSLFGLTYDEIGQRAIAYGGILVRRPNLTDKFGSGTFVFENGRWSYSEPLGDPGTRYLMPLVYDPDRDRVMMYGGRANGNASSATARLWELDPRAMQWTDMGVQFPGQRADHAAAYDRVRDVMVIHGGVDDLGQRLGDTWIYDPGLGTWSALSSGAVTPGLRNGAGMVFDEHRGVAVLFGGHVGSGPSFSNETWEWDGASWNDVTPAMGNPPARIRPVLVYDPQRRTTIMYGGRVNSPGSNNSGEFSHAPRAYEDLWEWDGSAWTRIVQDSTKVPTARVNSNAVYDLARGEVLHVSGEVVANGDYKNGQTWAIALPDPQCGNPCPADVNTDGMLTPADFSAWIVAFNASSPRCDQNGDGSCTPADFTAWIANFNAGC